FQAEDGIRDATVTGVQTCALPISEERPSFSFKLHELIPKREEFWELLARENVEAGRIEELYDQSHKADLDKRFLADLKRWRLLKIGRASCRERGEIWEGGVCTKDK